MKSDKLTSPFSNFHYWSNYCFGPRSLPGITGVSFTSIGLCMFLLRAALTNAFIARLKESLEIQMFCSKTYRQHCVNNMKILLQSAKYSTVLNLRKLLHERCTFQLHYASIQQSSHYMPSSQDWQSSHQRQMLETQR